jgi:hypothetical protein
VSNSAVSANQKLADGGELTYSIPILDDGDHYAAVPAQGSTGEYLDVNSAALYSSPDQQVVTQRMEDGGELDYIIPVETVDDASCIVPSNPYPDDVSYAAAPTVSLPKGYITCDQLTVLQTNQQYATTAESCVPPVPVSRNASTKMKRAVSVRQRLDDGGELDYAIPMVDDDNDMDVSTKKKGPPPPVRQSSVQSGVSSFGRQVSVRQRLDDGGELDYAIPFMEQDDDPIPLPSVNDQQDGTQTTYFQVHRPNVQSSLPNPPPATEDC